jgi:UDP-N-acetyl-2-amino-2-deoxyglucuronate dehydrogenase
MLMSEERLRLAIVGCGMASLVQFTPAMRYVESGIVTALCDPNEQAMHLIGRYFPAAARFRDYDELLASGRVDGVLLITPPRLHAHQTVQAARAGVHVFSEKPMAPTIAECDQMITSCAEADVTLMVGFMKRFDKSMRYAKAAIDDGSLGRVFRVGCTWSGQVPPHGPGRSPLEKEIMDRAIAWRGSLASGGGAFADWGAHTTDLARWWLGEIDTVSGEFEIVRPDSQVDDSAVGVFTHAGGSVSSHEVGWSNKRWHESYELDGTQATLDLSFGPGASHVSLDPFRIIRYEDGGERMTDETRYGDWSLDLEMARFGRYTLELENFCRSALDGTEPIATGLDGRKATEAVNAVYLSAFLGEKVKLPLADSPDLDQIFTEVRKRMTMPR